MTAISRGLLIMGIGIAFMSAMDATIKHLSDQMSAIQVLFLRAFFGIVPLLIIAQRKGGIRKASQTRRPLLHLCRAALGIIAFTAFTVGLRDMTLANALAICFAAPFFMVGFSALLIGEQIGKHRIGAMIAGFVGVLVVLRPDEGVLSDGAIYMIICAAGYALSQVLARKYSDTESALAYSTWVTGGMVVFSLIALPFFWVELTWPLLLWGAFMGIIGGIGHYLMTEAARLAPPAVVSPMEYTALIWAALFDWYIWQILPEHATVLGSSIIISSGIYILWREQHLKRKGLNQ